MDLEPPTNAADTTSASEYLDAEGGSENDYFHDSEEQLHLDDVLDEEAALDEAELNKHSIIHEIREELGAVATNSTTTTTTTTTVVDGDASNSLSAPIIGDESSTSSQELVSKETENLSLQKSTAEDDHIDYMQDSDWKQQKKHIFILSEAGKPIYSLHGKEDKLATLFGIIQTLVSFVQHGQDAITSIHARGIKFVFLVRNSLTLVAVSRGQMSVQQLQMQLSDVYNQIISTLTHSQMSKIFEKRKNFDLRRLLAGSERLITHLLANDSSNKRITNNVFTFLMNSIRVLPLSSTVRSNITSAIQSNCAKIKNLVFAVLIADNKLIALVRMKKYSIHSADLRLIFNLIECCESFKSSENWTPICLPKFDMNGYLHAHVSYLSEDCQACLLLLSVARDVFFTLSDAKKRITEKLRRSNCLAAISEEINKGAKHVRVNLNTIGIPELRHFLYKPIRRTDSAQLLCSELVPPYTTLKEFERLEAIYSDLLHRIHCSSRPLKLIYEVKQREVVLAWVTAGYELYAVFEPLLDKSAVIKYVDKLIKWIEKDFDVHFIRSHPTF